MNRNNLFYRIFLGIKYKPLKLLTSSFLTYASIWTILESLAYLFKSINEINDNFSGQIKFFILICISIFIGLFKNAVPSEIKIKYHGHSTIRVIFGDLFSFDGFKVIPVSRFFLETDVVETSLQSKIIKSFQIQNIYGENQGLEFYKKQLTQALKNEKHIQVYRKEAQKKENYYSLGTTAILKLHDQKYILFALTETEFRGCIPKNNCNISKMWISLEHLWSEARKKAWGESINIPLVGSGVTGIPLIPTHILELNLLSISNSIQEMGKITDKEIRIILHPKYIESINLSDFRNLWS